MEQATRQRVVLVGAGHAHLFVAMHADRLVRRGLDVTLVDPGHFWYSGMATGMLGGMYTAEEDQVDAGHLVESRGGRLVRDRMVALDRARRVVGLESGREIGYDVVSLNVGSEVALDGVPGADANAWSVKPTHNLWRLRQHLEALLRDRAVRLRVIVVGGGASGVEVAGNLEALVRRQEGDAEVMVITRSDRLLPSRSERVSRGVAAALERRGVMVSQACSVAAVESGRVVCSDGRQPEFDLLIVATGLRAPRMLSTLGLTLGEQGGLLVRATLQSVDDPRVLAVGDCADLEGRPLERYGVFAVRQSPILLANLAAVLCGGPLDEFRPQKRWLSILNLGAGEGLALWGPLSWQGPLALRLKDRIDRRFLGRYRPA